MTIWVAGVPATYPAKVPHPMCVLVTGASPMQAASQTRAPAHRRLAHGKTALVLIPLLDNGTIRVGTMVGAESGTLGLCPICERECRPGEMDDGSHHHRMPRTRRRGAESGSVAPGSTPKGEAFRQGGTGEPIRKSCYPHAHCQRLPWGGLRGNGPVNVRARGGRYFSRF